MDITKFKPTLVYTIYIASTPEQVWQALTSEKFSRKYIFGNAVEVDLRVGGAFVVRAPDGSITSFDPLPGVCNPVTLPFTNPTSINDDGAITGWCRPGGTIVFFLGWVRFP